MIYKTMLENVNMKVDGLIQLMNEIRDMLYSIIEVSPEAKAKYEEIQKLREKSDRM